jgi:hypothetical protein
MLASIEYMTSVLLLPFAIMFFLSGASSVRPSAPD